MSLLPISTPILTLPVVAAGGVCEAWIGAANSDSESNSELGADRDSESASESESLQFALALAAPQTATSGCCRRQLRRLCRQKRKLKADIEAVDAQLTQLSKRLESRGSSR